MLKKEKNMKKIRNIIIALLSIIMILGIYIKAEALDLSQGTINPIYKPVWEIDKDENNRQKVYIDTSNQTLSIVLKGTASHTETLDSGKVTINYSSQVTTALTADDITVYINGEEASSITKTLSVANPSTDSTIIQTLTLSNLGETTRQTDDSGNIIKNFKEWSGNISLKINGRGQDETTYTANELVDVYGNQSMMETDQNGTNADGTWIDITYENDEKNKMTAIDTTVTEITTTTPVYMFTDFIKPEFTYQYSNTTIQSSEVDENEIVTLGFDVTDKYFNNSTISADDLTIKIIDENTTIDPTKITKTLTKTQNIYYDESVGTNYVSVTIDEATGVETENGTGVGTKVGERYEIVIKGLDQGEGFSYSGPMSITFSAGVITDNSGNTNNSTTITIGIDETDGNTGTQDGGSSQVVDVVDPVWKTENIDIDFQNDKVTLDLIATDKYYLNNTISNDKILVYIDGVLDGDTNGNNILDEGETLTPTIVKALSAATNLAQSGTGVKYTLTLSNWNADEYSGTTKIVIPKGTITDQYTNTSNEQEFLIGHIDFIEPQIELVSVTPDTTAKTETIVFKATDKYMDITDLITIPDEDNPDADDEITVYVDGEVATGITRTLTSEPITETRNGSTVTIGHTYTLVLSNFEQTRTSINRDREYSDWSGTVQIEIAEGAVKDIEVENPNGETAGGNLNDETILNGDFLDFIKPNITYEYSTTDIVRNHLDQASRKFTMVFDVTDKYFASSAFATALESATTDDAKLAVLQEYLTIWVDGVDITNVSSVTKEITNVEDVTSTVNKTVSGTIQTGLTNQVIGKRFTLEISNLEQELVDIDGEYLNYSGVVSVALKEGTVTDTTGNDNNPGSITAPSIISGVNTPDGSGTGVVVDLVDPLWEIAGTVTAQPIDQTAFIPVKGTDKYIATNNLQKSDITITVTSPAGTISVTGDQVETQGMTLDLTQETINYGKKYNITLNGYTSDAYQVRITLRDGILVDESGNTSQETSFILFSSLVETSTETSAESEFLSKNKTEGQVIPQRQYIEQVIFQDSLTGINDTRWDVTQLQDESVWAWYTTRTADDGTTLYTVYIGSYIIINGNVNSSYLFANIGTDTNCKVTGDTTDNEMIENLHLLHVDGVTNMYHMFDGCGYAQMQSLDLGSYFDTRSVTNMSYMFANCGYTAMATFDLGDKFNTSAVTDMSYMFQNCGYTAMTGLDLGDNFNTSIVTDMSYMFNQCGKKVMASLDLGEKFDTINVTTMECMFSACGFDAMTSLDLGDKFDTSSVTNMRYMFSCCGYKLMTSLDLGDKFDTSSVTNMQRMFSECGAMAMTSLDLGDLFDTNNATAMNTMFYSCGKTAMTKLDLGPAFTKIAETNTNIYTDCGKSGECVIYAPESIYSSMNSFKLDASATEGTISYTRGTINPVYRPEWKKVSSSLNTSTGVMQVVVKTDANKVGTPISLINYTSDVTTSVDSSKITVYIDGELAEDITPSVSEPTEITNETTEKKEIQYTITISDFEKELRKAGKNFKEWSGNTSLQFAKGTSVDEYGNQNLAVIDIDTAGTTENIVVEDAAQLSANTTDPITEANMFTDIIKPEFTYEYSNTTIGNGNNGGTQVVTVVFDVTDKYFNNAIMNPDNITITLIDDNTVIDPAKITKTIAKKTIDANVVDGKITYETDGDILYDGTKVGERYELVITGLDEGEGFTYSGPMSITFPAGVKDAEGNLTSGIIDNSGNINDLKTITIGIDDPTTDDDHDSEVAVDVVNPVWKQQNLTTTTTNGITTSTVDLISVDKYYKESTLEVDDVQVIVAGVNIAGNDANGNPIAPELQTTLSEPVYIKWDNATSTYVETTQEEANGQKFTFTVSNLEETDTVFFAEREKYNDDDETTTGRVYREYSGPTTIVIPEDTIEDNSGNKNLEFTVDVGYIDTLKPEVIKVSSQSDINEENSELSTHTIVFDIVDKYLSTSSITATDTSMIHVYLDGEEAASMTKPTTEAEQTANSDKIFKEIRSIEQINATVNGVTQKVGYRYTLELSGFEKPRTSIDYTREYTDWSGDLTIKIDANTARDTSNLGNDETILAGDEVNTSNLNNADHVDYVKPDATYEFSSVQDGISDVVDKDGKTYSMVFDITDKFFESEDINANGVLDEGEDTNGNGQLDDGNGLSVADLSILMSAEEETDEGEDKYYNIMTNTFIGKALESVDITNQVVVDVVNGVEVKETKVIGKRYTLRLTNLEQLQRVEGNYYLDYSGTITISIPEGKIIDTSGNGNDLTTITSGIDIPGGEISNIETVDVVDPLWERTNFTTDIHNQTATITLLGTDKYFYEIDDETTTDDDGYGTLTKDEIKLFVNGSEVAIADADLVISSGTKLYEERLVQTEYGDGDVDTGYTTETVQYGIQYTITINNFSINKNQVKIQLTEGSLVDQSANESKATEFLVYNTLRATNTETEATSVFLGETVEEGKTAITRGQIERVVFVDSIAGSTADGVQNVWDVSAQGDNSILAWYSETSAPYTVYIGSNDDIYGNKNSNSLFRYIGYAGDNGENYTPTEAAVEAISNIGLLHTSNVTDMTSMFNRCGFTAMTSLDLGDNFDTSNVTLMTSMFYRCGYTAMTSLDLGDKFDTSSVTYMSYMFYNTGSTVMTSLDLGDKFNTSNVTDMSGMFLRTGYTVMETLDLGSNFDTTNVTNMQSMFEFTGYQKLKSLNLGAEGVNFNTSKVTNMSRMFSECGVGSLESFSLGSAFDTSQVTDMSYMFYKLGQQSNSFTTLDLGNSFNTSKVENMERMFSRTGEYGLTSLDLGENFDTTNVTNMKEMFYNFGTKNVTSLDLGEKFNTAKVTDMYRMFYNCGQTKLVSLDLGDLFYTTAVTTMQEMFYGCGTTAMTKLDLGPAFTKIASTNTDFVTSTGKSGECIIYAPESIYSSRTAFKLNSTSTTTIAYANGTINPIYRPEWEKVSSVINTTDKTVTVTLKGSAYKTQTVTVENADGSTTETQQSIYASNVTSTLELGDIQVFIDGVDVTTTTRPEKVLDPNTATQPSTTTNATSGKTEITHTFVLSNIEEAVRQTGIPYKEWSGNISLKIAGRGQATSTYTANVLTDVYGNQSMMETDEADGTWIDVRYEEAETDTNDTTSTSTMFADFTKPEFTYEYSNTIIGNGNNGGSQIVTVVFDVTDKYFDNTTMTADDITLTLLDDNTVIDPTKITKTLTKTQNIYYDATVGTNYIDVVIGEGGVETESGTGVGAKVGERYELVVEGLEQLAANGLGDGSTYSGPMSISFPADVVIDKSENKNNATTITIGIDETDGNTTTQDGGSSEIVDVVDPIIMLNETNTNYSYRHALNSITRNLTDETGVVKVRIRLYDKYLDKTTGTIADKLNSVIVKVQKPDGTVIEDVTKVTNPVTVTVSDVNRSEATLVEYELTLSNFTTETEGFATITIPEGIIKDSSGNGNKATEIYVGNLNWTGDSGYTAFNNSIVDVTRPIWTKATSSITRDRENEVGTVTLKILGYDIYYQENTLAEDKITVYVNGEAKEVDKSLVQITDTTELTTLANQAGLDFEGRTITDVIVGYTLTLSDFKDTDGSDLDGTVTIKIADDTIKDSSGNGNSTDIIQVGNPTWVETDVETDVNNPKYTAFRNSIVDFIKPVITYQYAENTNPILDRTNEEVKIILTATDTNFLENNLGLEDMKIYIDNMLVYGEGVNESVEINPSLSSEAITDGSANGMKYTLTLSALELNTLLSGEIFERHSGVIKIVIAPEQVADTSGNKNIETTIIIDNDDGDDVNNGVIADFVSPIIYYHDKYINWNDRYALITIRATDRFYDEDEVLEPSDIILYELNDEGQYIQITSIPQDDITITPVENDYGYDFVIRLDNFEEEFQMKINIPAGKIADTSENYNESTDIFVDLDNRKPSWKYVSTDTSQFEPEEGGTISFTVKGVDKFLDITNSALDVADLKVLLDGEVLLDGSNETDAAKITVNYLGADEDNSDDGEKSKSYKIDVTGLTEVGTYSLVFAEKTLVDEFGNESAPTTISFSKSAIASNTENYTNVTYHVTPDQETVHSSYVHELMSVNITGTNFENTTYRPSTIGELHNGGENPLFAEPMYDPVVSGYTLSYNYSPKSFAGWAEADSEGNPIYYTDSTLTTVSETETQYTRIYGLYDEIPNTVTNLKAVWQDATVVFVSNSDGNNSNDGKLPTTPVKDLTTAYSKLNSSGTAENNIIVIMDAIEWNSSSTLTGNATITSLYAGVDYRATQDAELKISSNMTVNGDIIFDNIELYSSSTDVSDGSDALAATGTYTNMLISNYSGDITLGRNITTPSDKYTFGAIIGGNFGTETSTGNLGKHTLRIEAGKYNNIEAGSAFGSASVATSTSKFVTHEVIIGNMRDAAVSRNDKLTITGYLAMGELEKANYPSGSTGLYDAYYQNYADVTLYSGTFTGENKVTLLTSEVAILLRSAQGASDGTMTFTMYGGDVNANIYGGARTASTFSTEVVNTMKFYGGTVTGNVFGQGLADSCTGSVDILLAGKINITGNVFGGSNALYEGLGNGTGNTNITINSASATVSGSVYGGSNGLSQSGALTGTTAITLNAGTVGNIYGSGNNAGNTGTTTITIENGTVTGNVFGGAHGSQSGNATITVLGGTIQGNIYGGNENTTQTEHDNDTTLQNVNITIGDTDATKKPTINGTIYGSGKYDQLGTVEIHLIECANITSVYGGSNANYTTETVNIYLEGMTVNEIYGGGQEAGTVGYANIYLNSGTATDVYGGGYKADVTSTAVLLGDFDTEVGTATVGTIYGGSNAGGRVEYNEVILISGNLTNVYGGGNSASVGDVVVGLMGITIDTIHGGSKNAGETDWSAVLLLKGTVTNVFGGGLDVGSTESVVIAVNGESLTELGFTTGELTVTNIYGGSNSTESGTGGDCGTTAIEILDATVENVYGGNYLKGTTKDSHILIHGDSTITGKLYGGGYKSDIGTAEESGSTQIDIIGGTINCDINGGSEQAKVYGTTNINIGVDAISYTEGIGLGEDIKPTNINILGTIYGAGDTLTSGETTVVGNTHILMDNSTESPITYLTSEGKEKSIYGSGKGGAIYSGTTDSEGNVTDESTIELRDFGTSSTAYQFASIERTGELFIEESFVELTGSRDTSNGHYYTLNRITDALTLYNNTTLYTRRGFNKVGGFNSYSTITSYGAGAKATVSIDGTEVTTNVDNRLYTLEGINLIFAKEEVTLSNKSTLEQSDWGEVNGMTYFGMYQVNSNTDAKQYDIYAPDFDYTTGTAQGLFNAGTYVEGQYNSGHNITTDGFYTNVVDEDTSTVIPEVIDTTNYEYYCDWIIGAETVEYELDLIASTYGTLSEAELLLDYQYVPEAVYTLNEVSLNALKTDVQLINPLNIPTRSTTADSVFALTMESDNSGWLNKAKTNIYTADNGSFAGDSTYQSDITETPGTLKFKIYNSIDITEERDLGNVNIILIGQNPTSDNTNEAVTYKIVIALNLQTILEEEVIIDEGERYYIPSFTNSVETELNFTTDSSIGITYLLYDTELQSTPYGPNDYRVLSVSEQLPAGTRITMKDYGAGDSVNKVYYYHITGDSSQYEIEDGRYLYKISNFLEMGSVDSNYEDSTIYYHSADAYVLEKYDFVIDFIDSNINVNKLAQDAYLQLRQNDGTIRYDNGENEIKYNLYTGKNAIFTQTISNEGSTYSVVEDIEIPITIGVSIQEQDNIMDTKYYDKISGVALQIVNEAGTRINLPELQNFKITNTEDATEVYDVDSYGVIRIPIMEGLATKTNSYKLTVTQSSVPSGTYKVKVHFYTCDDGKYYSNLPTVEKEFTLIFIDKTAGAVGIAATDDSRIINKSTGLNLEGNSGIDMTVNINAPTSKTNVRVELYKRNATYTDVEDESTYTGTAYTLVDISQYLEGTWESSGTQYEYMVSPKETYEDGVLTETKVVEFEKALKSGVTTGEYKLVFKAYSDDTLVQTIKKTFIVTP